MTSPIHPKPSSDKKRTAVLTLGLLVALVAAGFYFFDPIDRVRALSADVPREKVTLALGREPLAALAMIALDQKFFERAGLDAVRHLFRVAAGLESLVWLGDECGLSDGILRLPGHLGRHRDDPPPGLGDEQPLDATAIVSRARTSASSRRSARPTTSRASSRARTAASRSPKICAASASRRKSHPRCTSFCICTCCNMASLVMTCSSAS